MSSFFTLPRQGELGLGDTKNRLRAEIIRSLKTVNCVKVAAGGHHSMVVSHPEGLLFAFGSNSHGQLGLGLAQESDSGCIISPEDRLRTTPSVVDRMREYRVLDVACGLSHTLFVCQRRLDDDINSASDIRVYSMGLNTSGQCGLGNYRNTARPTQISLPLEDFLHSNVTVHTGPLSYHSYVAFTSYEMKRQVLPSVDMDILEKLVNQFILSQQPTTLTSLRELIAESFASISVLNSSFRHPHKSSMSIIDNPIDLDLDAVRKSYQLIFSTNSEQVA